MKDELHGDELDFLSAFPLPCRFSVAILLSSVDESNYLYLRECYNSDWIGKSSRILFPLCMIQLK